MKPKFEPTDDGLEIIDPIERHRYQLTTHRPVDPKPVDTNRIQFPVTTAVEVTTEMITLPTNESVYVRDRDGSMVSEVHPNKQTSLPTDEYTLDLSGPLKVYANIKSSVYIYSDSDHTYITFDGPTRTTVGARSYHRQPAETITTTSDPRDVMKVVSAFGSTLKSTTPERSYPSHRGHPPTVELGSELNIPGKLKPPNTGIRIEVPAEFDSIFVVAPLAYYLGAEVISGPQPRLITDDGFSYDLVRNNGLEITVEQVLRQVFFLDCVVRTEGPTPLPLHERKEIEEKLTFDIEDVYEQPLAKQLESYLSIPFDTVAGQFPDWEPQAYLEPSSRTIQFLPFLIDNLTLIRVQETGLDSSPEASTQTQAIEDFVRGDFLRSANPTRGAKSNSTSSRTNIQSIHQSWNGEKATNIRSKVPLSSFYHSIDQTPREDPLRIEVVCNDLDMRKELETVDDVYGNRNELPFEVKISHNTSKSELANILSKNSDFVHFIGHIDEEGFQCNDGKLDAAAIEESGTKAFFLNACQSYDQGIELVEAGSIGGIVTTNDVINSGAIEVGGIIARLLNRGFPLYAALDVAQRSNITGQQYLIVGNGMTTITQSESGPPNICFAEKKGEKIEMRIKSYITGKFRKGSLFIPYLEGNTEHFLTSSISSFLLSETEVDKFLKMEQVPIVTDGNVNWSMEMTMDEL